MSLKFYAIRLRAGSAARHHGCGGTPNYHVERSWPVPLLDRICASFRHAPRSLDCPPHAPGLQPLMGPNFELQNLWHNPPPLAHRI
jgi:hypothetical protein